MHKRLQVDGFCVGENDSNDSNYDAMCMQNTIQSFQIFHMIASDVNS